MFSIGSAPQPLTREDALFANPSEPTQYLGSTNGAPARVIVFHPSSAWLQASFPAASMGMGLIFPSLPGRDEGLRQVIPYWIGVAANGLPGNSAGA
jgi:hypothetical protein